MSSKRITGRLKVDTTNKTDIERLATSNSSDTYPSAYVYYTLTEKSLPSKAKTGTLFFTTDDRSLWLGTGDNIARVRVASDVISATDYYTRDDVISLFTSKEDTATMKADIKDISDSLKAAHKEISALQTEIDKKASTDNVYSKTEADTEFLNAGEMADGLAKKVDVSLGTADNFKQSVVKNTIGGVTIKFDNKSSNRFSEVQVADSRVYIAADTTDLTGDGSRLYVTPQGIFYTRNKDLNSSNYAKSYDEEKDEIVTQKQHEILQDICYATSLKSDAATQSAAITEGHIGVFKTSLTSAINTMNNAKFKSDEAMLVAEGAQSLTAQLQRDCVSLRSDLSGCQQQVSNNERRILYALDQVTALGNKMTADYIKFNSALEIAASNIAKLSNIWAIAYSQPPGSGTLVIKSVAQPFSNEKYDPDTDVFTFKYGTDVNTILDSLESAENVVQIGVGDENDESITWTGTTNVTWLAPTEFNSHDAVHHYIFAGKINDTLYANRGSIDLQAHVKILPSEEPGVPVDDGSTWSIIFIMPVGTKVIHDFKTKLQSQSGSTSVNFTAQDIVGIPINETTYSDPLVKIEMVGRIMEDSDTSSELEDINVITVEELEAMRIRGDVILYKEPVAVPVHNGLPDLEERLIQQRIDLMKVDSIFVSNGSVDYKDRNDTLEFTFNTYVSVIYRIKKVPL